MPNTYIKDSTGTWRLVQRPFVKVAGVGATGATGSTPASWKPVKKIFVKDTDTNWKQVFGNSGTITYTAPATAVGNQFWNTPGDYQFTVPAGLSSVTLNMIGGGGNGAANTDYAPGAGGGSAAYFSGVTVPVTAGQIINYSVGAAGATNLINPNQFDGSPSKFGALIAGGGKGGHWRGTHTPNPSDELGGEAGIATGTGGVNGTAGNTGGRYGGNGNGGSSPYGTGGLGTSSGAGGAASGYGAGGGGGGNNSGQGPGTNGFVQIMYNGNAAAPALSAQNFTVPPGVYSLNITLIGGGGGAGGNHWPSASTGINDGLAGSPGQVVSGTLAVIPGEVYTVYVGGNGMSGSNSWDGYAFSIPGINSCTLALESTFRGNAGSVVTGVNTRGGGGGGATVLAKGTTIIAVAVGGKGGDSGIITGSTRSAGGTINTSNVIPAGWTATTGTNGGAGSNMAASYSGSYSQNSGAAGIQPIRTALAGTYSALTTTTPSAVTGSGTDFNFNNVTLAPGVILIANGVGQFGLRLNAKTVSATGIIIPSGGFSVGKTVSGINFNTAATQGNGGQAFYFYTGVTNNPGGPGSATITY